jgi:hypothetical protein
MTNTAPTLATQYVFTFQIDTATAIEMGDVGYGKRRLIAITGGALQGPGIAGTVLPGGADSMLVRPDGLVEIDVRSAMRMDDGSNVYVENRGMRVAPKDEAERMKRGETIGADEIYFRMALRFETASEKYRWLMQSIFVGQVLRRPGGLTIDVHRVL